MNKMMIAVAAAALAGVASATICDPTAPQTGCRAYDFKASLKMVDGKTKNASSKDVCLGTTTATAYYRVKASRTVKGVFTDCDQCQLEAVRSGAATSEAESLLVGEALGGAHFLLSTSDSKYKVIYNASEFFGAPTDGYKFHILNFIGGETYAKSKVVEALLAIDFVEYDKFGEFRNYALLCAGFGARADALVKNVSGNLAGAVSAATWCGIPTQCYEPCTMYAYYTGLSVDTTTNPWTILYTQTPWQGLSPQSPAFDAVSGTWSLKYNSSKSKLSTANQLLDKTFGSNWQLMSNIGAATFPFNGLATANL